MDKRKKTGTTWCSAPDCFSNKISDATLAFFSFPKNEKNGNLTNDDVVLKCFPANIVAGKKHFT